MDNQPDKGEGRRRDAEGAQGGSCPVVNLTLRRVSSIICCFLLTATLGVVYTGGNLDPYMTSYLRNVTGEGDINYADTMWMFQAPVITMCALEPLVGLISTRVSVKAYLLIGIVFLNASVFGAYWAIKQSFLLTTIVYGVLQGVPQAVIFPAVVKVAIGWVPEKKGFICGVVLMGFGLGAVVWIELTTFLINPTNLQADQTVGDSKYFTQKSVLDNVPRTFLVLGGIYASIHVLCLLLLCEPPPLESFEKELLLEKDDYDTSTETQGTAGSIQDELAVESKVSGKYGSFRSSGGVTSDTARRLMTSEKEGGVTSSTSKSTSTSAGPEYHPKDVLKCRVFWTLWVMSLFLSMGNAFVITLFKAYGGTFIKNDHFLASVASISSVFNAVGRPFWGLFADRIGYRLATLIAQCVLGCLIITFASCEEGGKAQFVLWVSGMFIAMCGVYTMVPVIVISIYGAKYYNVIQGLLDTNGLFGVVLALVVAPMLKDAFSWYGLFYLGFGGVFLSVLLNMSLSVGFKKTIPPHMWAPLSLNPAP